MLEIIDITVPIQEGMVVWPSSPQTVLEPSGRMNMGESSNTTYCLAAWESSAKSCR